MKVQTDFPTLGKALVIREFLRWDLVLKTNPVPLDIFVEAVGDRTKAFRMIAEHRKKLGIGI